MLFHQSKATEDTSFVSVAALYLQVVCADVAAHNGAIRVIDAVLLP